MTSKSTQEIEQAILKLCMNRGVDKTVCPSEIARDLFPDDWREHMQAVRDAAVKLAVEGKIQITQQGNVIAPLEIHGPIRLRILE